MLTPTREILGWNGSDWTYAAFKWDEDLTTSKQTMVTVTNNQAYTYLQPTDWYVVRRSENGTPIPDDWNTWRQLIRDEAANKVARINACTSKEELSTYCQSVEYRTWSDQP